MGLRERISADQAACRPQRDAAVIRRGQDTVHTQWDMDAFLQCQIFVKLHIKHPSYGYSGTPRSKPFYRHLQVLVFFYILSSWHRKKQTKIYSCPVALDPIPGPFVSFLTELMLEEVSTLLYLSSKK